MHLSFKNYCLFILSIISMQLFSACSATRIVEKYANKNLIYDSVMIDAHVGILIVDAETNKPIYRYNDNKYFVPASNTKIITLYAGLKYLKDSLAGIQYQQQGDSLLLIPTGDPTFLHPDFPKQPVFDFLKREQKPMSMSNATWKTEALGEGWMWDDYNSDYMTERSAFPVYGNVIRWIQMMDSGSISALARQEAFIYSEPDISWKVNFSSDTGAITFSAKRSLIHNTFFITQGKEPNAVIDVPYITNGLSTGLALLKDSLLKTIDITESASTVKNTIRSQPVDSLFKIMMYRSDNFFAEQILLMASNEQYGIMDEKKIISDLLQEDLKDFPQTPVWADGSGLSRYNLFSPQDFVWILSKMKHEYGMERLKKIFPQGATGTLLNYYKKGNASIFAKTGTMSGVVCLSGYLYGKSGKLMLFSFLVNDYIQPAWKIRQKVEAFLETIREKN